MERCITDLRGRFMILRGADGLAWRRGGGCGKRRQFPEYSQQYLANGLGGELMALHEVVGRDFDAERPSGVGPVAATMALGAD